MELKVYYGSPKGVWVYLNGRKLTTEQATDELLIRGKVQVSESDRGKDKPAGLFSSNGDFYIVDSKKPQQPGEIPLLYGEKEYVAPIDYDAITPDDLLLRLIARINALKGHIKEEAIEIQCFNESPPN
jgi:hypothetical protein